MVWQLATYTQLRSRQSYDVGWLLSNVSAGSLLNVRWNIELRITPWASNHVYSHTFWNSISQPGVYIVGGFNSPFPATKAYHLATSLLLQHIGIHSYTTCQWYVERMTLNSSITKYQKNIQVVISYVEIRCWDIHRKICKKKQNQQSHSSSFP